MIQPPISIRPIVDLEGCRYLQEVHRRIWASADDDIVPLHVLITMAKNGGLLLGAYAPDGPPEIGGMVGFVFGWLGAAPGRDGAPRLKHCSHIAGVLPAWQGRGVGVRLKLAQRQSILEQGVTDWATWTYDPLYRVNGALNIHRLGAICTTYLRNVYGEMPDALNAGVPTDRCQVDWYLRGPRVLHALSERRSDPPWDLAAVQVLPTSQTTGDLPAPGAYLLRLDGTPVALPLPDDVGAIRRRDGALLLEWRLFLRDVLERAFAAGYALVDCVRLPGGWHYVLVSQKEFETSRSPYLQITS
jgi:predicted GNAT superfamily acetyltransferase